MSWSSGKDSAFALAAVRDAGELDVTRLLVTVNADAERVAMHAVRRSLLDAQADRLRIDLRVVEIPFPCPNEVYEARMGEVMAEAMTAGVEATVFGDLFLEDVRAYREEAMSSTGMSLHFPLWSRPTYDLARDIVASGVKAVLTCVDPNQLDPGFAGRAFDDELLADLPSTVDPCGEWGEFHTFVWDGDVLVLRWTAVFERAGLDLEPPTATRLQTQLTGIKKRRSVVVVFGIRRAIGATELCAQGSERWSGSAPVGDQAVDHPVKSGVAGVTGARDAVGVVGVDGAVGAPGEVGVRGSTGARTTWVRSVDVLDPYPGAPR